MMDVLNLAHGALVLGGADTWDHLFRGGASLGRLSGRVAIAAVPGWPPAGVLS